MSDDTHVFIEKKGKHFIIFPPYHLPAEGSGIHITHTQDGLQQEEWSM